MSIAEETISRVLEERLLSLTLGKNLFRGPARPPKSANGKTIIPEECVFCLETGGPEPTPCRGNLGGWLRFCAVQVTVRSCLNEYAKGRELAAEVYKAMAAFPVPYEWARVTGAEMAQSCPIYIGKDDGERHRWTINIRIWLDDNVTE